MGIRLSDLSVLVVDDNPQAIRIMKMVLSGLGVSEIATAKDGMRAREIVAEAEKQVHLVICDWNMPGLTGLQLLKEIRDTHPNIRFMMVTGNVDVDSVRAAKQAGVDAFIAKPVTPNQVKEKLRVLARQL